jgi:hypothetical protein
MLTPERFKEFRRALGMSVACPVCSVDVVSDMSVLWALWGCGTGPVLYGDWDVCAATWGSVSNIGL